MGAPAAASPGHLAPYYSPWWLRQVAGKQMVGVYLSVWVRRRLLPAVRGVQVTAVGTGVLGYLGNKGAPPARTTQSLALQV